MWAKTKREKVTYVWPLIGDLWITTSSWWNNRVPSLWAERTTGETLESVIIVARRVVSIEATRRVTCIIFPLFPKAHQHLSKKKRPNKIT